MKISDVLFLVVGLMPIAIATYFYVAGVISHIRSRDWILLAGDALLVLAIGVMIIILLDI